MNPFQSPALKLARSCVNGWTFHEPCQISFTNEYQRGANWFPPKETEQGGLHFLTPCRIEIGCEEDIGILYHEAFHSAFFSCPLSKIDGAWAEGFCNAFAACSDGIVRPKFELTEEQYAKAAAGHKWTLLYGIPEALILQRAVDFGRTPEGFREFFLWANRVGTDASLGWFSAWMGYEPATGKSLP